MGQLDPDDPRAPFQQVADAVRSDIRSGALAPGAQLPPLQALAREYEVSLGTVKSALGVLREAGLVVTRPGKGSYVRTRITLDESDVAASDGLDNLRRAIESLTERVEAIEGRLGGR